MRHADYVYRNNDDTRRVRIFKTEGGTWDFDIFRRYPAGGWGVVSGQFASWGDTCRTRKECFDTAEDHVGALTPDGLGKLETVTQGWPERPAPKATKDAAIEIKFGQIWRFGTRKLRVDSYGRNPMKRSADDGHSEMLVGCRFIEPSGREVGVQIRHRRSAHQQYGEQQFREKFRFVREL